LRLLLIGDSICLNSEKYIKENLEGVITLHSPPENCESSNKVRKLLETWLSGKNVDIVHINCGLHDVRYDPGCDHPVSTKGQYEVNLNIIFRKLAEYGAKIIWATSTPIDEKVHNETKVSRRYLKDIAEYNKISINLAKKFSFKVNDLFSKVSNIDLGEILLPDGIHFNEAGNAKIGELVSKVIKEASYAQRSLRLLHQRNLKR
jgi:lysophospholipase L1-like esterase